LAAARANSEINIPWCDHQQSKYAKACSTLSKKAGPGDSNIDSFSRETPEPAAGAHHLAAFQSLPLSPLTEMYCAQVQPFQFQSLKPCGL
jgi:hypothetical protein